ncbi:carboxypeptidase-like regulatory domain-containing protein [Cellulophaga baltica]|uniref:carboxypeptidase-like regulatory domain-containing protein n=1 Tax=Cellulophaga baltica TaxID=76594 RepID=UPI002494F205|nr:carboxypeptidase-like regulatory domain-containing protein [Cellulophaga baltica]
MRKSAKEYLVILILFQAMGMQAQDHQVTLEGNVQVVNSELAGIHVQNISTKRATITDGYGFFALAVRLSDTVVFSSVQLKNKEIIITQAILESKQLIVPLEEADNELEEVVVMLYNLSGDLSKDARGLKLSAVSSSTLGLPNTHVVKMTYNERKLLEADRGTMIKVLPLGFAINTHKILNRISGRTKMLKERIVREEKNNMVAQLMAYYPDSIITKNLKIPDLQLHEFVYFCETDENFDALLKSEDQLLVWEFLERKSIVFLKTE